MTKIVVVFILVVIFIALLLRLTDRYIFKQTCKSLTCRLSKFLVHLGIVLGGLMSIIPLGAIDNKVVYIPLKNPAPDWNIDTVKYKPEDVYFQSDSGNKIHAWHLKPNLESGQQPDYFVLYFHGNAGNLTYHSYYLNLIVDQLNADVFCIDYSGYGLSEGTPSEKTVYLDGQSALKEYLRLTGKKPTEIIVMGRSLGGAIAMDAALKMQLANNPPTALVLESTFSSIPDMAKKLVPILPAKWLLTNKLDTASKLKQYRGNLYITHGTKDRVVPYAQALNNKKIAQSVSNRNGKFVFYSIENMDHNDNLSRKYFQSMNDFLKSCQSESDSTESNLKESEL